MTNEQNAVYIINPYSIFNVIIHCNCHHCPIGITLIPCKDLKFYTLQV